jgi:hypothetical protein
MHTHAQDKEFLEAEHGGAAAAVLGEEEQFSNTHNQGMRNSLTHTP